VGKAATRTGRGPTRPRRPDRTGLLVAGLSLVALTVAVLQTAVVPVLGVIADQLHASPVAVSWAVTANLLAAAAATPVLGRLADLYRKKTVLLAVLAVVLAGSVLAAAVATLPALIVARVLQGASYALYPIGVAILREELPPHRLNRALTVLSATLGFGGGAGLVVTGLLMAGDADYRRVFWLATVFTTVVLLVAAAVVPRRDRTGTGTVDWVGAAGLAAGLSAVLLAITQGGAWGWTSPWPAAAGLGGAALLGGWWWWERRVPHPLVSTRMLARRAMLLTNAATVLVGMGLYFSFLGLTQFVQAPRDRTGYGFSADVLSAAVVFLLPGALAGFAVAMVSGRWIDRFGARRVLAVAALVGVCGFGWLALAHDRGWQVIVAGLLTNVYISLGYGALPALVVAEAGPGETGVATGMNAIARTVGSSVAAAVVAVLLARTGPSGLPVEGSYVATFAAGAVTAALAMVLIGVSRAHDGSTAALEARAMNHEWG